MRHTRTDADRVVWGGVSSVVRVEVVEGAKAIERGVLVAARKRTIPR